MPRARTFKSVFTEQRNNAGEVRWRVRGSGVKTYPTNAALTAEIELCLEAAGIAVNQRSSGSPANADCYRLEAAFEDGGFYASTGNYWYDERGAWIKGRKAVDWIAAQMGLRAISNGAEGDRPSH